MRKITLILICLCSFFTVVFSQPAKYDFLLDKPAAPADACIYSKAEVIDGRYDTTNLGMIWVGTINDTERNDPPPPLPIGTQIRNMILSAITSPAENGELLIHLRFFKFSDMPAWSLHKCFCFFRAGLYEKSNDSYKRICMIDTSLVFYAEGKPNELRDIFNASSVAISGIIMRNLTKHGGNDRIYSMNDILNTDSIEKRDIPVYNTSDYKNGVYTSYSSFKIQQPDFNIASIDTSDGQISGLKIVTAEGKKKKLSKPEIYAVIYGNKIYLQFEDGFTPLGKIGDDFYLTSKLRTVEQNSAERNVANAVLGISTLIGSHGTVFPAGDVNNLMRNRHLAIRIFEMKIDHLDGIPIKLKEVEKYSESNGEMEQTPEQPTEKEKEPR